MQNNIFTNLAIIIISHNIIEMNSGFNPKVLYPHGFMLQTLSDTKQPPFYFGGSQVPYNLSSMSTAPSLQMQNITDSQTMSFDKRGKRVIKFYK